MIVIKIEMWPGGVETRKREIGRTYIGNVGETSDPKRGDYEIAVCRRGADTCPWPHGFNDGKGKKRPIPARAGKVLNYPRLSYNVWQLVIRGLLACFPEELPKTCKRCKNDPSILDEESSRVLADLLENPPEIPEWVRDAMKEK